MKAMDTEGGAPAHNSHPPQQYYSSPDPLHRGGQYSPGLPKQSSSTSSVINLVRLILRVLALILLFVSLILLSVAKQTVVLTSSDSDYTVSQQVVVHFGDFTAYKYTMSAIIIGFVYTIVQTIISVLQLVRGGLGGGDIMLIVSFYGDKLVSYLLGMAAAAGFGMAVDAKNSGSFDYLKDFFNKGNAACSLVFIAFIFTAASSILSSYALPRSSSRN